MPPPPFLDLAIGFPTLSGQYYGRLDPPSKSDPTTFRTSHVFLSPPFSPLHIFSLPSVRPLPDVKKKRLFFLSHVRSPQLTKYMGIDLR